MGTSWGALGRGLSWLFDPVAWPAGWMTCPLPLWPCRLPSLPQVSGSSLEAPPDPGHSWPGRGQGAPSGTRVSKPALCSAVLPPAPLVPRLRPAANSVHCPCVGQASASSHLLGQGRHLWLEWTFTRRPLGTDVGSTSAEPHLTSAGTPPSRACLLSALSPSGRRVPHLQAHPGDVGPSHRAPVRDGVQWRAMPGLRQLHRPPAMRSYF